MRLRKPLRLRSRRRRARQSDQAWASLWRRAALRSRCFLRARLRAALTLAMIRDAWSREVEVSRGNQRQTDRDDDNPDVHRTKPQSLERVGDRETSSPMPPRESSPTRSHAPSSRCSTTVKSRKGGSGTTKTKSTSRKESSTGIRLKFRLVRRSTAMCGRRRLHRSAGRASTSCGARSRKTISASNPTGS